MEIDKKLANLIITSDIQDTWNYKCLSDEICDQRKWNLTLWSKINQLSAKLRRCLVPEGSPDCLIVSPDCLIVSPEINSIISDDSEYCVNSTKYHAKNGLEFSGEITGRYRIYTNYNLPANILILGRESEIFGPNNDIKCVILKVDNIPTFNQEKGLKKTNDLNNEVYQYVKEARSCFGSVIDKLVKIISPETVLEEVVKENRTSANKQLTFAYTHKEVITAMNKFHAINSHVKNDIEDIINALPLGTFAISAPYHTGDSWSIHTNDDDFIAPTLTEALIMYKKSLNKQ